MHTGIDFGEAWHYETKPGTETDKITPAEEVELSDANVKIILERNERTEGAVLRNIYASRPIKLIAFVSDEPGGDGWVWVDNPGSTLVCPSSGHPTIAATWGFSQPSPIHTTKAGEQNFLIRQPLQPLSPGDPPVADFAKRIDAAALSADYIARIVDSKPRRSCRSPSSNWRSSLTLPGRAPKRPSRHCHSSPSWQECRRAPHVPEQRTYRSTAVDIHGEPRHYRRQRSGRLLPRTQTVELLTGQGYAAHWPALVTVTALRAMTGIQWNKRLKKWAGSTVVTLLSVYHFSAIYPVLARELSESAARAALVHVVFGFRWLPSIEVLDLIKNRSRW